MFLLYVQSGRKIEFEKELKTVSWIDYHCSDQQKTLMF